MNIFESITKIMDEGYAIGKDKKNPQQGYLYRGIDQVMNVFQPLLAKYKVFLVPEVLAQTREERTTAKGSLLIYSVVKMKYTFYAEDGTSVYAVVIGEGMDSGDKSTNKAMSVAMKYAMFQTFCIPTEEMRDPEEDDPQPQPKKTKAKGEEHKKTQSKETQVEDKQPEERLNPISKGQIEEIIAKCKKAGVEEGSILGAYQVKGFEALTFGQYSAIAKRLDDKIKAKNEGKTD